MLRIERPPRWPLFAKVGLRAVWRAKSRGYSPSHPVGQWRFEHLNQGHRCGGSVGFTPTSRPFVGTDQRLR